MQFLGGLGYGGGAIINGALLEDLGKKGEKITSGFKLAVDSIVRGKKYLAEHRDMRFIVYVLFTLLAGIGTISCVIIVFIQNAFGTSTR